MTTTDVTPGTRDREPRPMSHSRPSAVVWINRREAVVAATGPDGMIQLSAIERGLRSEAAYLSKVVRRIGDRERVMILGPGSTRLALEREYVALYRRPHRLVDVEPSGSIEEEDLVERVRALAA